MFHFWRWLNDPELQTEWEKKTSSEYQEYIERYQLSEVYFIYTTFRKLALLLSSAKPIAEMSILSNIPQTDDNIQYNIRTVNQPQ
jgi:hypothetical protein